MLPLHLVAYALFAVVCHGHHHTVALNLAQATSAVNEDGALTPSETSWSHGFQIIGGNCINPRVSTKTVYAPTANGLIFSIGSTRVSNIPCTSPTNCTDNGPQTCQPFVSLAALLGQQYTSLAPGTMLTVSVSYATTNTSLPTFAGCSLLNTRGNAYYALSQVELTCGRVPIGPSPLIPAQPIVNIPDEYGQYLMSSSGEFRYSLSCPSSTCQSQITIVTPSKSVCLAGRTVLTAYENGQTMSAASSFELNLNGIALAGGVSGGCHGSGVCDPTTARLCVAPQMLTTLGNTTKFTFVTRFHSAAASSCATALGLPANLMVILKCELANSTRVVFASRGGGSSSSSEDGEGETGGLIAVIVVLLVVAICCGFFVYYKSIGGGQSSQQSGTVSFQGRTDGVDTMNTGTTGGAYNMDSVVPAQSDAVMAAKGGTTQGDDML